MGPACELGSIVEALDQAGSFLPRHGIHHQQGVRGLHGLLDVPQLPHHIFIYLRPRAAGSASCSFLPLYCCVLYPNNLLVGTWAGWDVPHQLLANLHVMRSWVSWPQGLFQRLNMQPNAAVPALCCQRDAEAREYICRGEREREMQREYIGMATQLDKVTWKRCIVLAPRSDAFMCTLAYLRLHDDSSHASQA